MTLPRVLTIAGSDSGGGAGIQADLKSFQELGAYGMTVITALTAQDTLGVHGIHEVPPEFVTAQLDAVAGDIGVDAAKTGMLASTGIITAVAEGVRRHRIDRFVVDPVCASKHGDPLLRSDAVEALRTELLPLAELITPNLGEVTVLTGIEVLNVGDLRPAAEALKALGPRWVLVKGGHLPDNVDAIDLLYDGRTAVEITATRLDTRDTHGTGDTLASAITVARARGLGVVDAVRAGKEFVTGAIRHGLRLGRGIGPIDPGWRRRAG
ncbi:MAG: bifunctional hydroxymethylpyrimidine kinase/phosphomethylpyrimidine kinase [Nitriliruptorales bacterium]|nr:bifunctional hydroxymethylpyrimidine kinase/phosphomethylpyrimidine kinase [Nitriliruptorales bacterium]